MVSIIPPIGYYGIFSSNSEEEYFARPVEETAVLDNFVNTFGLIEKYRSWSFNSNTISDPDITTAKLCEAAIQQFFYPIIARDLMIGIFHDEKPLALAYDSIKEILSSDQIVFSNDSDETLTKDNFIRLIQFTEWILKLKPEETCNSEKSRRIHRVPPNGPMTYSTSNKLKVCAHDLMQGSHLLFAADKSTIKKDRKMKYPGIRYSCREMNSLKNRRVISFGKELPFPVLPPSVNDVYGELW